MNSSAKQWLIKPVFCCWSWFISEYDGKTLHSLQLLTNFSKKMTFCLLCLSKNRQLKHTKPLKTVQKMCVIKIFFPDPIIRQRSAHFGNPCDKMYIYPFCCALGNLWSGFALYPGRICASSFELWLICSCTKF